MTRRNILITTGALLATGSIGYAIYENNRKQKLADCILTKVGIIGKEGEEAYVDPQKYGDQRDLEFSKAFDMNFWQTPEIAKKIKLKGEAWKTNLIKKLGLDVRLIENAFGGWFVNDDEDQIYSVFRSLNSKTEVSILAWLFHRKYKKGLYTRLSEKLTPGEMAKIKEIVDSKPVFK